MQTDDDDKYIWNSDAASEWVSRVKRPTRYNIGHFEDGLSRQNAHKHIVMEW